MARSSSDIDTLIAALKTARNTRDASIETAAAALDGSNDNIAARLRSLKHVKEIAQDVYLCVACTALNNSEGVIIGMSHNTYYIDDTAKTPNPDIPGLKSLLADESLTIPVVTTVENL